MTKVVLNSVTGNQAITHNANSEAIEAAIENTLSRNGATPNQMEADLDMNGYRILNVEGLTPTAPVITGDEVSFGTVAIFTGSTVDSNITRIFIQGYLSANDGGGAQYQRVVSEPTHPGKLQSSDGAWWEYFADETGEKRVNVRAFGAKGNGVNSGTDSEGSWSGTDDTTALQNAESAAKTLNYPRYLPKGNYIVTDAITSNDFVGLQESSNVLWYGEGEESVIVDKFVKGPFDNIFGYIGRIDSETATDVTLSTGISKGDQTLVVNDASLLSPGQWVHITDHSVPVFNSLTGNILGASGDFVAVSDGITSTTYDFTTESRFAVNKWIKVGGTSDWDSFATSANNGFARITAVTANKITLTSLPAGWTADAGTGKEIRIWFKDNAVARQGFPAQIYSVNTSTNEVGLYQQSEFDMAAYTGLDPSGDPIGTTLRRFTDPCKNISFKDMAFTSEAMPYVNAGTDPTHTDLRGKAIQVIQGVNISIDNVIMKYVRAYEIVIGKCIDFKIQNTKSFNTDLGNVPRYSLQASSCFGLIENHVQYGGRHGTDGGANPDGIESCHVTVSNCLLSGLYGAALGTHHGTRAWTFSDNTVVGSHLTSSHVEFPGRAGFQSRGRQHNIVNNRVSNCRTGIYAVYSEEQTLSGNDIENCYIGIEIASCSVVDVHDNRLRRSSLHDIYINPLKTYNSMDSLRFIGNKMLSNPSSHAFKFGSGGVDWNDNWVITDNYIPNTVASYSNVKREALNTTDRIGKELYVYGDTDPYRMQIRPASAGFPRHQIVTHGDVDFSISRNSVEAFRVSNPYVLGFIPFQLAIPTANQADLEDISHGFNTSSTKQKGSLIFDQTNDVIAISTGSAANSPWVASDKTITYAVPS